MKKVKHILILSFLAVTSSLGLSWTIYYDDFETGSSLILEDSEHNIILGFGDWSIDSFAPNIVRLDKYGTILNRSSCIPDSFYDGINQPYPEDVIEIQDRRYACLFCSYFSDEEPWAMYTIVDSSFNVLQAVKLEPPLPDSRYDFGSLVRTSDNSTYCMLYLKYYSQPDRMLHILEIEDTGDIIRDTLMNNYTPGEQYSYNAQTMISQSENQITLQVSQGPEDEQRYALLNFSFEEGICETHTFESRLPSEMPQRLLETEDGSLLTLWRWDFYSGTPSDHNLQKYSPEMELEWSFTIADSFLTNVLNFFELESGNHLVAGFDSYDGGTNTPFAVIEVSPAGGFIERHTLREELRDSLTFKRWLGSGAIRCRNGDYVFIGNVQRSHAEGTIRMLMRLDSLFHDVPLPPDRIAEKTLPKNMHLFAYPNPFNSTMEINARLQADISIFDTRGRLVAELGNNRKWSPKKSLPSGIYLVRSDFNGEITTIKTVYLK